jgi:hypothetical protein
MGNGTNSPLDSDDTYSPMVDIVGELGTADGVSSSWPAYPHQDRRRCQNKQLFLFFVDLIRLVQLVADVGLLGFFRTAKAVQGYVLQVELEPDPLPLEGRNSVCITIPGLVQTNPVTRKHVRLHSRHDLDGCEVPVEDLGEHVPAIRTAEYTGIDLLFPSRPDHGPGKEHGGKPVRAERTEPIDPQLSHPQSAAPGKVPISMNSRSAQ